MRPPRMRTRRWMVLIGFIAVILSAAVWQQRRIAWKAYCREKVEYHTHLAQYQQRTRETGR